MALAVVSAVAHANHLHSALQRKPSDAQLRLYGTHFQNRSIFALALQCHNTRMKYLFFKKFKFSARKQSNRMRAYQSETLQNDKVIDEDEPE